MLSSAVSSRALAAMAAHEGFVWAETLTGFKWLGNVATQLQQQRGLEVLFAFEEAIGFMFYSTNKVGQVVVHTCASRWNEAC
jgi:phosphoglucomutase